MRHLRTVGCIVLAIVLTPWNASASKGSGHSRSGSGGHSTHSSSGEKGSHASTPLPPPPPPSSTTKTTTRDSHGRIKRSESAKRDFERQSGYPHGRPGYVVDHIVPLACGGADAPGNMQWQTIAAAKAKDKTERLGCR